MRRSLRTLKPVHRYGFSEESEDEEEATEDEEQSCSESEEEGAGEAADISMVDEDCVATEAVAADGDSSDSWKVREPIDHPELIKILFLGEEGMVGSDPQSPQDFLDIFFPDHLVLALCQWTNSRAFIEDGRRVLEELPDLQWKPVDLTAMRKFIGLSILMGIIKKPTIRSYWCTSSLTTTPYFLHPQNLSRDRYLEILRFIRFSNPYEADAGNSASRLDGFLQKTKTICKAYHPGQSLAVDESLLLFKGRLSFKLFIRVKRSRFGIKLFALTDSNGYFISCIVYFGSTTDYACAEPGHNELNKSEQVVVALLSHAGLLDRGHIVNVDNWYCSLGLVQFLQQRHTGVRGTVRANRGIPQCLKEMPLRSVSSAFAEKDGVLAIKFADKKDVYFLSTADGASEVEKQRRKRQTGAVVTVRKPSAIDKYNQEMCGIDKGDQLLTAYNMVRKSHCWFKKVGFNICMRLLLNAFLLSRRIPGNPGDFLSFLQLAVTHFTGVPSECHGRRVKRARPERPQQLHRLRRIPPTAAKRHPTRRCRLCAARGVRKETRYECAQCADSAALCIGGTCFEDYHHL